MKNNIISKKNTKKNNIVIFNYNNCFITICNTLKNDIYNIYIRYNHESYIFLNATYYIINDISYNNIKYIEIHFNTAYMQSSMVGIIKMISLYNFIITDLKFKNRIPNNIIKSLVLIKLDNKLVVPNTN